MKAVVVGEKSDTLDKLSSVLAAGGIGVHNVESAQQFFRRLDEFRAAPPPRPRARPVATAR